MRMPAIRFDGQTVFVTGASSGIGRAAALAFADAGANVVLVARRTAVLSKVAAQARKSGAGALAVSADVTQAESVRAAMRKAATRFGRVDLVINNAGVLTTSPVATLDPDDLQRMLDVNLFGALHVMQASLRQMGKQPDGGHIVNVASLAGRRGFTPLGGYCASKFALVGLTEALRTELVGGNVGVSLVMPGVIDTPMAEAIASDPAADAVWPKALNMPVDWVVWAIFAAARFRLAEVAVPPGSAMLEKLASLAPGTSDVLLRQMMTLARRMGGGA